MLHIKQLITCGKLAPEIFKFECVDDNGRRTTTDGQRTIPPQSDVITMLDKTETHMITRNNERLCIPSQHAHIGPLVAKGQQGKSVYLRPAHDPI